jgi:hypothetical protein
MRAGGWGGGGGGGTQGMCLYVRNAGYEDQEGGRNAGPGRRALGSMSRYGV